MKDNYNPSLLLENLDKIPALTEEESDNLNTISTIFELMSNYYITSDMLDDFSIEELIMAYQEAERYNIWTDNEIKLLDVMSTVQNVQNNIENIPCTKRITSRHYL